MIKQKILNTPKFQLFIGAILLVISLALGIVLISGFYNKETNQTISLILSMTIFGLGGIYGILNYINTKYVISENELVFVNTFKKVRKFNWTEIVEIKHSKFGLKLKIVTKKQTDSIPVDLRLPKAMQEVLSDKEIKRLLN